MRLLLIGLNHNTTSVELREKLYLSPDQLTTILTHFKYDRHYAHEVAIVSTCNRFEVYSMVNNIYQSTEDIIAYLCDHYGMSASSLRGSLYIMEGRFAVHHLMSVASGLDSMVLGEAQILGQVNDALKHAKQVNTMGPYLHRLFESALKTGKRARSETQISQHTTSISHAAASLVYHRITHSNPRVLILGAGEMAEMAVQALIKLGMMDFHIVNRTIANAEALVNKYHGTAYAWSQLWEQLQYADVVISAIGAPHIVLYKQDIEQVLSARGGRPLLLVDVAVPRTVDSETGMLPTVTHLDIDDLQQVVDDSLAQRQACIPEVQTIITEEEEKYWSWRVERRVAVPVIRALREKLEFIVQHELEDAFRKLPHLDEQSKAIVKRMSHRILNKMLYPPTAALRAHATDDDTYIYTSVVRNLFDLPPDMEKQHTRPIPKITEDTA